MLAWAALYVHAFMSDTGPGLSPKTPMPTWHSTEKATDHSHVSQYVASSQGHTVSCLVLVEGAAQGFWTKAPASSTKSCLQMVQKWPLSTAAWCPPPSLPSVSKSCHNGWSFSCWDLPFQPPKSCNWQLSQRPYLLPPSPSACVDKCAQVGQSPLNSHQSTRFCFHLFRIIVLL